MWFRNKLLLLIGLVHALPLHMGHGEELLRQRVPHFLLHIFSTYEHMVMRVINYLAVQDWIYRYSLTRRMVNRLSEAIMSFISGEILSLEEARGMIETISGHGYTIAVGTCPCRRARNQLSDRLPNNTDMVFGTWAEEYLKNYPGLYERLTGEEALRLVEEFDRHGCFHQIFGFPLREGAAFVLCNCPPDVCIPLQAQRMRGYKAFRRGRSVAVVDRCRCVGLEECSLCIERCPFGARTASDGRSSVDRDECFGCGVCVITCRGEATSLERMPGAELIFARNLVD